MDKEPYRFLVNVKICAYLGFTLAVLKHGFYFLFVARKFYPKGLAGAAAQGLSFGLAARQGFFCPPADKASFNLRRNAEGKGQHPGLEIVFQMVLFLDGYHFYAALHAAGKDGHDHKEGSAQPGEFGTDDCVAGPGGFKERTQPPILGRTDAAGGFLDPPVDNNAVLPAILGDFVPLIFNGLPVRTNPDISVCHVVPLNLYDFLHTLAPRSAVLCFDSVRQRYLTGAVWFVWLRCGKC
jgi:hypothetical protein